MSEECSNNCGSCSADCGSRRAPVNLKEQANEASNIKKVIAVISGKGGVGKSLVTSLLTVAAKRKGCKAAVLDADVTGPSIPKAFGIHSKAASNEYGLLPAVSKGGVSVMSVNLLLENETDPVIWRGPVISGVVKQFWTDVAWGDIDYMFIDMPPGTGDVPLTVMQSLPIDGIVVVTSPQDLVSMIVGKSVQMAKMMNIPIIGIVENMSYFKCPDCGKEHRIFGESHLNDIAAQYGIDRTAALPINSELANACDEGRIEGIAKEYTDAVKQFID
ncbi:MAG: Mrp/NBP35 family ATP-binding protein [Oscillospiraceae bacterium]|nr:Mrp/NBP35 family ATP-binding protein [Oscillospiraceae bacterium]